jgi:hypothetical protein
MNFYTREIRNTILYLCTIEVTQQHRNRWQHCRICTWCLQLSQTLVGDVGRGETLLTQGTFKISSLQVDIMCSESWTLSTALVLTELEQSTQCRMKWQFFPRKNWQWRPQAEETMKITLCLHLKSEITVQILFKFDISRIVYYLLYTKFIFMYGDQI